MKQYGHMMSDTIFTLSALPDDDIAVAVNRVDRSIDRGTAVGAVDLGLAQWDGYFPLFFQLFSTIARTCSVCEQLR